MPLQFERRIEFPNGDIGRISFAYEGLYRYCFTCHMILHDENACPQLTPEERELKRQQRAEINAQGDLPSIMAGHEARAGGMKRHCSPFNGHHSPSTGRHWISPSNQLQNDYRREDKRQKHSPSRENRAYHPYHRDYSKNRGNSHRDHSRKEYIWRRIELPPRTSSGYGKANPSRDPPREKPYS